MNRTLAAILLAAVMHFLLFFVVFTVKTAVNDREERADLIRLVDVQEHSPPPPPTQPRIQDTSDPVADQIIETDTVPPPAASSGAGELIDFLPQSRVTQLPRLSEDEIKKRTVYPPIAQRAGLEGTVFLEIFVDRNGLVRNVTILKEDPEERGFGEAAAKALLGLKGSPAIAGDEAAACRFRYRFRFQLR